jgi:hypothetical protein
MSRPRDPVPVRLFSSLFSPEKALIEDVSVDLSALYGPLEWVSPEMSFDRTDYYEREMGWPLYRRFVVFTNLIRPEDIVEIKLETNDMEQRRLKDGKRRINIDPGYLCAERVILATGKNFTHRVYLAKGIYADLTLIFQKGTFRALEWTYKDYADPSTIQFLNQLRKKYMERLKERDDGA